MRPGAMPVCWSRRFFLFRSGQARPAARLHQSGRECDLAADRPGACGDPFGRLAGLAGDSRGAFAVNATAARTWETAAIIALGNTLEGLAGGEIRFGKRRPGHRHQRHHRSADAVPRRSGVLDRFYPDLGHLVAGRRRPAMPPRRPTAASTFCASRSNLPRLNVRSRRYAPRRNALRRPWRGSGARSA